MISSLKKGSGILFISTLLLTLMVGCSSTSKPVVKNATVSDTNTSTGINKPSTNNTTTPSSVNNPVKVSQAQNTSQKLTLTNIKSLAKQGKVINSEFTLKTTVIETVEKKLGKPDKIDWVPKAKGNYATYSKHKVVFGFNKGSQIFEIRSFDNNLRKISLSMVKKSFGVPAYDVKSNGQEIIGYTAGQEYKILLVFQIPTKGTTDPLIDHYSVLYPRGTVNMMADDHGREW